jgi:hypothetical protein
MKVSTFPKNISLALEAQKLMGDTLIYVWAEFSTLSKGVSVMSAFAWHLQACPRLEIKTRPRFCPVS